MQDNIQARKCKIPTESLMKNTVSTQSDENQYQDRQYNFNDQHSDAESVEAYDENELNQDECNDEMENARNRKTRRTVNKQDHRFKTTWK